jgi:hypothetical protein
MTNRTGIWFCVLMILYFGLTMVSDALTPRLKLWALKSYISSVEVEQESQPCGGEGYRLQDGSCAKAGQQ